MNPPKPILRKLPCQAGAWRSFWERQALAWPLDGMFFIGYHLMARPEYNTKRNIIL